MKKLALVVSMGVAGLMTGCLGSMGGKAPAPAAKVVVPDCVWEGTERAAPGWICDEPVEGVAVSAVGVYEKTAAGEMFQRQQATAAARVTLASEMKTHVSNMIKQYAETTGSGSSETVDRVNTSVSKTVTSETLTGSKVFKSAFHPVNGKLYVLVGFDPQTTATKTKEAVQTSLNNDKAAWQQFKAKQGQDELAAAIAAQPPKQ
jgi:hypothetical protein